MKPMNSFKSKSAVFAMGFTVLLGIAPFATAEIITPLTGTATGSSFATIDGAFDAQPISAPTVGPTDVGFGGTYTIPGPATGEAAVSSRAGFLDFGLNYADITLETVNVLLRQFGPIVNPSPQTYTWSDDTTLDGSDVAAPDFNFFSDVSTSNGTQQWTEVWTGSAAVQSRYLIYQVGSAPGNRLAEIALVGTVDTGDTGDTTPDSTVPEPASVLLLGLGGLLITGRRSQA